MKDAEKSIKITFSINFMLVICFLFSTGLSLAFAKFVPGFRKSMFNVYFQFKFNFKVKNVLNSITTLKRYCKANLNVFFYEKNLMMTKHFYPYDRFFVLNPNFLLNLSKSIKIPGFSGFFQNFSNSRFFQPEIVKFQVFQGLQVQQPPYLKYLQENF